MAKTVNSSPPRPRRSSSGADATVECTLLPEHFNSFTQDREPRERSVTMFSTTRHMLRSRTLGQCLHHCRQQPVRSVLSSSPLKHRYTTSTKTTVQAPILSPGGATRSIPPALPNKTIKTLLTSTEPGTSVKVQGWIRSTRQQKHVTFMEVNDGSSLKGVQAILSGGQGKG